MEQINQSSEQDHSIIWIDRNIYSKEYEQYLNELGIKYYKQISTEETACNLDIDQKFQQYKYHDYNYNILLVNDFKKGVETLKKRKNFSDVILIVGGNSFDNFVEEFKRNLKEICVIPSIIVFTPNERCHISWRNNLFNCCVKNSFYLN